MTKQLIDILNLTPEDEPIEVEPDLDEAKEEIDQYTSIMGNVDKIDAALPMVEDLSANDTEMDELAQKAQDAYKDLIDLGMNVDTKYCGRIFEVAASMLGHAITAKTNKIDKKLKMIDLQIKKARLDQNLNTSPDDVEDGEGQVVDRNELLRELLNKIQD